MKHDERALTSRAVAGPALHVTSVFPDGRVAAVVGLLHGYAEHGARYAHVMEAWASRGVGTIALDLRGHGRAEGPRGHCGRFEEYLDDAAELARLVADRASGAPAFLFGHSFGGLVAASSAIESPRGWRGLVLSNPYFGLAVAVPAWKRVAARVASRVHPRFALPTGLRGADLTHDVARAKAYDEDPLVFGRATARWFTESARAQAALDEGAKKLTMPLRVTFGADDPVAEKSAARRFFDAAASADKTWDERPGLLHETLNEPSWESVAGAIADWILARA